MSDEDERKQAKGKTCGHYGGMTEDGSPCGRPAGAGTESDTGTCEDHEPEEGLTPEELHGPAKRIAEEIKRDLNALGLYTPADKYIISALASSIWAMMRAREEIDEEGVMDLDDQNRTRKNPAFVAFRQMEMDIKKLTNSLGLSPHGRRKLKEQMSKEERKEVDENSIANMID